jgi:putative chitinase
MSAAAFFDAGRSLKRELTGEAAIGLTQSEVDALNAVVGAWHAAGAAITRNPTALGDAAAFFAEVRKAFGALTQPQVEGFQALLQAVGVAGWPLAWAAYGLATAWHETAARMEPVKEAFWLTEEWRKLHLRYAPWYGRGFVQLTWQKNYERADEELGLGGVLLADPDVALKPDVAARIMVRGMEQGWFCGKRLGDYFSGEGEAPEAAFVAARHIINGNDKAEAIAKEALAFERALRIGGWA